MTERELQAAVVECAQLFGWRVYHTYDSRRSAAGFPDLCMVKNGVLLFAELKSATGRLSGAQDAWYVALRGTPALVFVWRPEHWTSGDIESVLRDSALF